MYGMIAKLVAVSGRRDDLIKVLKDGTAKMPGCLSYVIAKDTADENTIWVTEAWDSVVNHDKSLSLPIVKATIDRAKPLVAEFSRIAVTEPVAGIGASE